MQTITAYKCDHCSKVTSTKGSMTKHERACWKNEANKHKCFEWCENLNRESVNDLEGSHIEFTCKATNEKMYSYKAEFVKSIDKTGLKRMPLECDKYKYDLQSVNF